MKLEIIRKLKNSQYVEIKQHCPEQPTGQRRKQTNQTLKITRDKEGHYIMNKGSIQEEDITIVNIYSPNIGAP